MGSLDLEYRTESTDFGHAHTVAARNAKTGRWLSLSYSGRLTHEVEEQLRANLRKKHEEFADS